MATNRWIGGLAVTAVTAGVLLAGSGTAFADDTDTQAAKDRVCTERIPAVLERIDKLVVRINGDAKTRGSTAWLVASADKARANGLPSLADLLVARADARPERVETLEQLRADVENVLSTDCAA